MYKLITALLSGYGHQRMSVHVDGIQVFAGVNKVDSLLPFHLKQRISYKNRSGRGCKGN